MGLSELQPRPTLEECVNRAKKTDVLQQDHQDQSQDDTPRHPRDDVIEHDRVRRNKTDYQRSH